MSLIDLIFPRECLGCSKQGPYLCFECKKKLTPHPELCPFCHTPQRDFKTCQLCKSNWETALEWVLICFSYQTLIKKLIPKLKFYHKKDLFAKIRKKIPKNFWEFFNLFVFKVLLRFPYRHISFFFNIFSLNILL